MNAKTGRNTQLLSGLVAALFFAAAGSLVIVVFSPWNPLMRNDTADYFGRLALIAFFLILHLLARRSPVLQRYALLVYGLLVLAVVVALDWVFAIFLIEYLGAFATSPLQIALAKLNEVVVVAAVIIVLTRCSGQRLGEIYLQPGKLKLGLGIGLAAFALFVIAGIPMANAFFNGSELTLARALPWTPWLLITVFSNSALEELMFRGLFLRKLEPFLGKFPSNLLIAVVFTLIHYGVTYTPDQLTFLLILFPLALVLGYLAQKTNALWASILLHAGMDIPVFLGIFSNL